MFKVVMHDEAKTELIELPNKLRGEMFFLIEKLEKNGQLRMPQSKAFGSGLFELRVIERNNIARCIYTYQRGNIIFLLHAFVKKNQKTPTQALAIAKKRLQEMLEND